MTCLRGFPAVCRSRLGDTSSTLRGGAADVRETRRGLTLAAESFRRRRGETSAVEEPAHGRLVRESGANRNVLRMVPPMCISEEDVEFFAGAIEKAFERV